MSDKYEQLVEDNIQLKKALISSKSVIERKINELETQTAINEEMKQQLDKLKQENIELQNKLRQVGHEKKQIEQQFDNTTKNWKLLIEQKQREIEEIQSKLVPSFDQDMMRIKIINELEVPHRQQLEAKHIEVDKLNEQIYDLRRIIDLGNVKLETMTLENQKQIKMINDRHQIDLEDMHYQINELSKIIEDNRDKETIRKLRKDLDEYKFKYTACDTENEELRSERDKIREEKNEFMVKFSRQLDAERNDKRQYKGECEKLSVRVRFLEEEYRKEKLRRESQLSEFEVLKSEKDVLQTDNRKKDDTVHYLQRKITEMEEEQLENEEKVQEKLTRLYHDEHDKYLQERNKAVTLSKDLDAIKKRFSDISDDYKTLKDRYLKENMDNRDNIKQSTEEIDKLKKQVSIQSKDIGDLERSNKVREEQLHDLDNELETVKRKNRELQHRIQLFELNPLPPQPINQDNYETKQPIKRQVVQQQDEDAEQQNQVTKQSMQQINEENRTLVSKVQKLQAKLKQANDKIMELQLKNKIYEKQHQQQLQQQQQPPQHSYSTGYQGQPYQPASTGKSVQQQQSDVNHISHIQDDDLIQRVMMLTNASSNQRQVW